MRVQQDGGYFSLREGIKQEEKNYENEKVFSSFGLNGCGAHRERRWNFGPEQNGQDEGQADGHGEDDEIAASHADDGSHEGHVGVCEGSP